MSWLSDVIEMMERRIEAYPADIQRQLRGTSSGVSILRVSDHSLSDLEGSVTQALALDGKYVLLPFRDFLNTVQQEEQWSQPCANTDNRLFVAWQNKVPQLAMIHLEPVVILNEPTSTWRVFRPEDHLQVACLLEQYREMNQVLAPTVMNSLVLRSLAVFKLSRPLTPVERCVYGWDNPFAYWLSEEPKSRKSRKKST